jgi:WD40 repeat protein
MTSTHDDWTGLALAQGRYHIRGLLGKGGMGLVYRARDVEQEGDVVVKVPRPEVLQEPDFTSRFSRELHALVYLSHPSIVRILAVGTHQGVPFAVLPYLSGGTLRRRQPSGPEGERLPLPACHLDGWLPAVAAALDFLHGKRHVHRDVKPENIFFDAEDRPYLGDFGFVKALADDAGRQPTILTRMGKVVGTPQYIAPEVLRGRRIDGRADQYALGVMVYELLSGRAPFDGNGYRAIFEAHLTTKPPPLDQLVPELPVEAAAAVHRAMARDPNKRFADCATFAGAVLEKLRARVTTVDALSCPQCGQRLRALAGSEGKPVECPACATSFLWPAGSELREARGNSSVRETINPASARAPRSRRLVWAGLAALVLGAAATVALATGLLGSGKETPAPPASRTRPHDLGRGPASDAQAEGENEGAPANQDGPPKSAIAFPAEPVGEAPMRPALHETAAPPALCALAWALTCTVGMTAAPAAQVDADPLKLVGHTQSVACVAFSPDGKYALTAGGSYKPGAGEKGEGCELRLWDLATGKEVRQFPGHTQRVEAVAFSPDGKQAVSASFDKTLKVWDVGTGKELKTLSGHRGAVYAVAFSPGGRYVVSGSSDRTARVWDVQSGTEVRDLSAHKEAVGGVVFSPDGRRVLTGGWDARVYLWDVVQGTQLRALEGHTDMVRGLAFSPDGKRALTGSGGRFDGKKFLPGSDHGLRLWDLDTGAQLLHLPLEGHIVRRVAFTPDGKQALSCGQDSTLHLWDLEGKKHLKEYGRGKYLGWAVGLGLTPEGQYLLGCLSGKEVHVWRTGLKVEVVAAKPVEDPALSREVFTGHKGMVEGLALTPDGKLALSGGGDAKTGDYTVLAWDTESLAERFRLAGHTDVVRAIACSPKGRFAASAGNDEVIRLWDLKKGVQLGTLQLRGAVKLGQVVTLAFTPDERYLISGGGGPLVLWDVKTGAAGLFPSPPTFYQSVAVSPNGGFLLAGAADGVVRLYSLKTRQVARLFRGHTNKIGAVGFTKDGKRAFTVSGWKFVKGRFERGEDNSVRLWNVATGKPLKRIDGKDGPLHCGALSPDGRLVATGGVDGMVRLWDLEAGREVHVLRGHTNLVTAVLFFPDGRRLLSASQDGTVRLWRVPEN